MIEYNLVRLHKLISFMGMYEGWRRKASQSSNYWGTNDIRISMKLSSLVCTVAKTRRFEASRDDRVL